MSYCYQCLRGANQQMIYININEYVWFKENDVMDNVTFTSMIFERFNQKLPKFISDPNTSIGRVHLLCY